MYREDYFVETIYIYLYKNSFFKLFIYFYLVMHEASQCIVL